VKPLNIEPKKAMSAKEAMMAAADALDKRDIQELKSFGKPPAECIDVCAACAFLLRSEETKIEWKDAQRMLSNPTAIIQEIRSLDVHSIELTALNEVQALLGSSSSSFDYEVMKGKSAAAANLALWVSSVVACHEKYVQPAMEN